MDFQTHCNRYLQRINRTRTTTEATPELSLYPHLQAFLERLCVDHFDTDTITLHTRTPTTGADWETGLHRNGRLATARLYRGRGVR